VAPRHGRDSPRRPDAYSRYARVHDAVGAPAADRRVCETCGRPCDDNPQPDVHDRLERQACAIAQALHDESGQLLSAAHLALSEIVRDVPEAVRARVNDVRKQLDLTGMRERLAPLGGRLDVRSAQGRGTDLVITIPVED